MTAIVDIVTPYKGLAPFEDSDVDALLFFGRERESEIVAMNLLGARLTVLYGPTGVGKSSLLRAGAARKVRELAPEADVVVFSSWRDDPIESLREAIAPGAREGSLLDAAAARDCELYLVLDQFEEYFLYHADARGEDTLVHQLPELVNSNLRVNVLLGVREDALAKLDVFKARLPRLFSNYLRLDHLDREAARDSILGPLARYAELTGEQWGAQSELVESVLDEVAAGKINAGRVGRAVVARGRRRRVEAPFLQLVLERLWDVESRRGSRTLTLESLRELGGAERIVEDHLERAIDALTPAQQDAAAAMFEHLVTPSGSKIAHRLSDLATYASVDAAALEPIVGALEHERILRPLRDGTDGGGHYEIYHDVLAGAVLVWLRRHEAQHELELERRRARERNRRTLLALGVVAVALAVMTAIAVYALTQRREARMQAQNARGQARVAQARQFDAEALSQLDVDPQRSLQLAYRAAVTRPGSQAEAVLRRALLASRLRLVLRAGSPVVGASFSPGGRRIVVAGSDGTARIFAARTGRLVKAISHGAPLRAAWFSRDGRLLLTAGSDGRVRLWRPLTGKPVRTLRHGPPIRSASFSADDSLVITAGGRLVRIWRVSDGQPVTTVRSPVAVRAAALRNDGRYFVVAGGDDFARVYDAVTGALRWSFDQGGQVTSASFTPSGAFVVTSGSNRSARTWSVLSGRELHSFGGHQGSVVSAVVDPRGRLLATASADGTTRVWEIGRGGLLAQLIAPNRITGAAFAPNGFSIVTTSKDGTARVWQPSIGTPRAVLAGHTEAVTSAAFSPDSARVVTASDDGTARVWDPQTEPDLVSLGRYGRYVSQIARSPDGRLLVVGTDRGALLVRATDGQVIRRLRPSAPVRSVAFSRDGRRVAAAFRTGIVISDAASGRSLRHVSAARATAVDFGPGGALAAGGADGRLRLWLPRGSLLRTIRPNGLALTSVHFDRSGRRVVTGSEDFTARVWDVRTGKPLLVLRGHKSALTSARFSPDDRFVLTSSRDNDARIWNLTTGKSRTLTRHFGLVSDAEYSPDGRFIVTAGPRTVGVWDVRDNDRFLFFLHFSVPWVTAALFEPDSQRILAAGHDGTVRGYRCDVCGRLPALVALAKRRLAVAAR